MIRSLRLSAQMDRHASRKPKVGIKIESVEIVWYYQDYAKLDYFNPDELHMMGCHIKATVSRPIRQGHERFEVESPVY